ncbi:MAG: hypothetical protein CL489_10760 [Acidobacteria bacterium]|nr:hypothetical protein [Acidobacteriota bacterium]|tara:strand:- start:1732 stop:2106 length:375 start_codon:yes stop_codon:yes gene_type:complete
MNMEEDYKALYEYLDDLCFFKRDLPERSYKEVLEIVNEAKQAGFGVPICEFGTCEFYNKEIFRIFYKKGRDHLEVEFLHDGEAGLYDWFYIHLGTRQIRAADDDLAPKERLISIIHEIGGFDVV